MSTPRRKSLAIPSTVDPEDSGVLADLIGVTPTPRPPVGRVEPAHQSGTSEQERREEARKPAPERRSKPAAAATEKDSLERADPVVDRNEKLPAYAPHSLIERLRNTVVALQRTPEAEDAPATLSELCQQAVLREVQRLERKYNDGNPFPERSRKRLRTGRPIQG
jgi:hypothetical protein